MKYFLYIAAAILLSSCNQQNGNTQNLQNQIDSLQANAYKPGFGEFMSSIQVHHNKLWFAGQNQNWELADFEINEIKESLANIKKFCTDRPETNSIDMIEQPLQNLSDAIQQKNKTEFINRYTILTATCNSCHQATKHGFNVITIPTTPPFSDQSFKPQNEK
ncbi:hypothetical protein [Arachidicoccus soli]|uniref:Cytochrome c domain-containing protein n=1 Tax=Arachidicoccus soli TaxID=2341117 RepID=A0A386HT55_9BACT|nr:hypothetical protein [Arachidicoccus soli]AYD48641.1 hypothetical protein D6B99_14140 [Arachidicoccus soli]